MLTHFERESVWARPASNHRGAAVSANNDPDLKEWLRWQAENGCIFLRSLAEVAYMADTMSYMTMRPTLLAFQSENPIGSDMDFV